MQNWIILPYDSSPVARAALRRAAKAVRGDDPCFAGVILAIAGVDPAALDGVVREAQAVAGPDVPLESRLLAAGDPVGALRRLRESVPDAVMAAPLGVQGGADWYVEACRRGVT